MTTDELKKEFEKYLKDSSDYYDPREPLTKRKLLQMWLDCADPREKRIAELERKLKVETELSNRLGLAYREYEQLTKDQDEHLAELKKENARLKDGIALKDEEVGCIETVFNTFKSKAKVCLEQLVSEITVGELEVDPNILQQAEQLLNSEEGK